MKINIFRFLDGARQAHGLTVIIDVFRAFTVACYVFRNGAKKIIPVQNVERALKIRKENPGYIITGERYEKKVSGFDFGNSPSQIEKVDFTGKTVIQTTSAGTRGLVNAKKASILITGSFVNADAIVRYINNISPETVSLVAMGYSGKLPVDEDLFCAEYIRNSLEGRNTDFPSMVKKLKIGSGKRFFISENKKHSPPNDFYLCTQKGIFDFILKAERNNSGMIELKKEIVK